MQKFKKFWKVLALLSCAAMAATSFASCGKGAKSDNNSEGGKNGATKNFVILECRSPESAAGKAMVETAKQFQEDHPNFNVDHQYVPEMITYKQKIKTLIASNEIPDMFNMDTDPYARQLLDQGYLKDITEICERHNIADIYYQAPFEWGAFSDGIQIGLPAGMDIETFWYNKQIFEEAGISIPKTMDEFMNVCEILKEKGFVPLAMSGKEPWTVLRYFTMMSFRLEGNDFINGLVRGERKMTEDTGIKVAEFVRDLGVNGYFQEGFASTDQATALNYFCGGSSAMYYSGTWDMPSFTNDNLAEEMHDNIDYFLLPNVEGGPTKDNHYIAHGGTPYCFSASTFDDTTEEFLVFFANNFGVNLAEGTEYTFSPNVGCNDQDTDFELYNKAVKDLEDEEGAVRLVDVDADPTTNDLMNKLIISLALGEISVDEFCTSVDEAIAQNAPEYFS